MDGPPLKRVKVEQPNSAALPALPPGWTEHTAPTGHKYYYHKATKKSTYTRPSDAPAPATPVIATTPTNQHDRPPLDNGFQNPALSQQNHFPHPPPQLAYGQHAIPQVPIPAPNVPYHPQAQALWQPPVAQPPTSLPQPAPPQQRRPHPQPPNDRPKRKAALPTCPPWILVYTRLGRRFAHNPQTGESFWKFPPEVMDAAIEFDRLRLEEKLAEGAEAAAGGGKDDVTGAQAASEGRAGGAKEEEKGEKGEKAAVEPLDPAEIEAHREREAARLRREMAEDAALMEEGAGEGKVYIPPVSTATAAGYDSSEYEEVEVTDSEGEEGSRGDRGGEGSKAEGAGFGGGPLEFNEEDIERQLAMMGQEYGLDPEEYGGGGEGEDEAGYTHGDDDDEGDDDRTAGLPMSDEERYLVFASLLRDHGLSPYTPWDALVDDASPHAILADERFTAVPGAKRRREAHARWCKEEVARLQAERAERKAKGEAERDPKAVFEDFLRDRVKEVKRLYWVEFRRKFKREQALRPRGKWTDKEMEKVYRDHVARLKGKAG